MLTVSDFGIVIDDECQARYDFSLYMMPHTYSLYLEARNEIFNAKSFTVDRCISSKKEFEADKYFSYLNSNGIFRAFIGIAQKDIVNCKITIGDLACYVENYENFLLPQNYIPLKNTE